MSEYVPDYVWAFVLALVITFALTPLVKRFAVAVGAIDKPDARKVHHGAIPRLGGLAIFLGYIGSVLFNNSIPHDFIGKFGSANVLLKRAPEGTGIIAGGPARAVVELAGIKNIRTKSLGSNNKTNVVLATVTGLTSLKTPEQFARLRGKSVEEIVG